MKSLKKIAVATFLLLSLSQVGSAQSTSYSNGDALLYFISNSKNVQIDLGNIFTTFPTFTLDLSNASFMTNAFGSSWPTGTGIKWGIVGGQIDGASGNPISTIGYNFPAGLDTGTLSLVVGNVSTMASSGTSVFATTNLFTSGGNTFFVSSYNPGSLGNASATYLDSIGFGAASGSITVPATGIQSITVNTFNGIPDTDGTYVAPQVTAGYVTNNAGVFNLAPLSSTPSGTNVWSSNSGNLSAIGITNNQNLIFTGSGGLVTNNAQVSSLSGITFSNAASSYILSGSDTALGASGITNNSSAAQTVANNLILSSAQSFNAASGDLRVTGAITNAYTLTIAGSKNTTLAGAISGVGGLTMAGTGTTTLSAASTFGGNTLVSSGTLLISGYGNTNSAVTVASGGVLSGINAGGAAALGAVTVQAGGKIAPGNVDGTLNVQSLTLASNSLSVFDVQSTNANGYSSIYSSGNIVLGGALSINVAGGPGTYTETNNPGYFQLFKTGANITGNVQSVTLTGTYYNGTLTFYSDLNLWSLRVGGTGPGSWYANFDQTTGQLKVVPEPSTYALFVLSTLLLLVIYRRKLA